MIDYSHIPIYVRLSERWKIDPAYSPEKYRRREELLEHSNSESYTSALRRPTGSVLAWLNKDMTRCLPASGILQMLPVDLLERVKTYRKCGYLGG